MRWDEVVMFSFWGLALIWAIYSDLKLKKLRKEHYRNEAVYRFRIYVLDKYPNLYDCMPTYDEMMTDKKPLKMESYFTEEEIMQYD